MKEWTLKCLILLSIFSASTAFSISPQNREVLGGTSWSHSVSCVVSQLSQATSDIKWMFGSMDIDGSANINNNAYIVDKGESSWTHDSGQQTTTLTVTGSGTTELSHLACYATHSGDTKSANVVMRFYTIATSNDIRVTTGNDQTLSCTISGLGSEATIKWIDPDNVDVPTNDADNYVVDDGESGFAGGIQTTQLTIKAQKLRTMNSAGIYKCSVTSTYYPGSPSSVGSITVTPIVDTAVKIESIRKRSEDTVNSSASPDTDNKIVVIAANREVKSGTDAVVIGCTVTGITAQLGTVKWTNSVGTDVFISADAASLTVTDGSFDGSNSQTTILTVAAEITTADATYSCLITPAAQDDATEVSTSVALKVYTVTSSPKDVTTAVDQTLTCTIGELDANGDAVTVTWKDPSGNVVSASDTPNYELTPGTVDGSGVQNAELKIKAGKLADFSSQSTFTYKCSVTSSQYPGSPASADVDVVANVLTFANTAVKLQSIRKRSENSESVPGSASTDNTGNVFGIEAKNSEVLKDTQATISCVVTGLTKQLDTVAWQKPGGTPINDGDNGYGIAVGTWDSGSKSQTTILTIPAAENTADKVYTCVITSNEYGVTERKTDVNSNVYTITPHDRSVTTGKAQDISCTISGLGSAADIKWKDPNGADIDPVSQSVDYTVDDGKSGFTANTQVTKLTLKADIMGAIDAAKTYTCQVTSSGSPSSTDTLTVTPIVVTAVNKEVKSGTDAVEISCQVTGLTAALGTVKWTNSDGNDVTTIADAASYTVTDGSLVGGNSQTTTLTVAAAKTNADATYSCLITPAAQDDATEVSASVALNTYTITPHDRSVTTGKAQDISCTISGLGSAADIKWIDPENNDIGPGDTTNYVVVDGKSGFIANSDQVTTLTIKSGIMGAMTSAKTYTCQVTSSGSPSSTDTVTVTPIVVTAVNKEVKSGTDAVEISCQVTGITTELGTVKWTNSDGNDVTTIADAASYTVTDGSLVSGNSQTTTLTVAAAKTTADATYSCLITPAGQDDATEVSASVALNIYTITPHDRSVTTGKAQDISCTISGLGSAADIKWKDPNGADIDPVTHSADYAVDDGKSGFTANTQVTKLTLKSGIMSAIDAAKTYTCQVTSSGSPSSTDSVTVTPIVVTAVNKEVLSGTNDVVISCQVTGITAQLGTVKWTNSDGNDVTTISDSSSYTVTDGSLEGGNSQTTTLTVKAAQTTGDRNYNCLVTPAAQDDATEVSTSVVLNTYTINPVDMHATDDVAQTLTCNIGDLTQAVTVSWKDTADVDITDGGDYTITQGTVDSGTNKQESTLTISSTKLQSLTTTSPLTWKCAAKSVQYPGSEVSAFQNVVVTFVDLLYMQIEKVRKRATSKGKPQRRRNPKKKGKGGESSPIDATRAIEAEEPPSDEGTSETEEPLSDEGTSETEEPLSDKGTSETEETPIDGGKSETEGPPSDGGKTETEKPPSVNGTSETEKPPSVNGTSETEKPPSVNGTKVEAKNSEVLTNTLATISCVVSGITQQLDTVLWQKPGGTETISHNVDGYLIDVGTYNSGTKSQTTILTIPANKNTADGVYTCVITSNEHGKSSDPTSVNSNVFTISPVNMDATDDVAQTLTCNIGDLTQDVEVSWKDPSDVAITASTTGYTITQGSVTSNIQKSTLTIDSATLKTALAAGSSPLTWKCAAKSKQYTESEQSAFQDVVVTFLTYSVEAKNSEVLTNTQATISCVVSGLTKQLDTVIWQKPGGTETIAHNVDGYLIDVGTYNSGAKSQTTILTIPANKNTADGVYTCVITSNEHGKSSDPTSVNSNVFTISPVNMDATDDVAQTLTCDIGDLTQDVEVSWKDPSDAAITASTTGYTITQGSVSSNIQESTLTIDSATLKSALAAGTSPLTWKCAAKSKQYTDSELSAFQDVVVTFLTYDVEAKNSEVLTNTQATISCVVNGLTKQLDTVIWQKPGGTETIAHNVDGYLIDVGTYNSGTKSQTTILTIPANKNSADGVYTCVITSNEHGKSSDPTSVNSNVFTISPVNMDATDDVAQTLTCNIGDLTQDVEVSWKDPSDVAITASTTGYTITQGSVTSNIQESTLTIDSATLKSALTAGTSPLTWKCAAKSKQYTDSEQSGFQDVVVTFLTYGVEAKNSEVLTNTQATISCVVNGLTKQLDTVIWQKPGGTETIAHNVDGYLIDVGTYNSGTKSQTTILTIPANKNSADGVYTCVITSNEHGKSADPTSVNSNVFTIAPVNIDATDDVAQTLTCNIGDLTQDVEVSWKDPSDVAITASTTGYTITQGSVSSNIQESTLTIDSATLKSALAAGTSPLTWKCAAKSKQYTESEQSAFQDVVVTFLTYEVEAKNSEVLTNTQTTISCVVNGLTKQLDTVIWQKPGGTETITHNVDGYLIDVGTYNSGTKSQTTILTIPANKNTADSVYTCVITSNEHGKSSDPTSVNSNVFMMELTSKEVIKGSDGVMTCTVTEISSEPTITWIVNGKEYIDSTDDKYKVFVGTFSVSEGTIASELTVKGIADDTAVTCKIRSADGDDSVKSDDILTFGLHAHDDVVLKGGTLTLSCKVDGFDDGIDKTTDIEWLDSDGQKITTYEWNKDALKKSGTTTLEVTDVQKDTSYTCKIRIDQKWEQKTISVDMFELTPVGDVISSDTEELLARILVTELSDAHSASDKLAISWRKDGASEDVADNKLHQYTLPKDGLKVPVDGISTDETYKVTVSITVFEGTVRTFQETVFIDFVNLSSPAVIKETGTEAVLSCTINNVKTAIKSGSSSWTLAGTSGWNKAELTHDNDSQTITNTKSQIDYETKDEGEWTCSVTYELATSMTIERTLTSKLNLDIPAFTTKLENEFAVDGQAVTFTCVARNTVPSGYTPTYSWSVKGVTEGSTSTELIVTNTKDKDNYDVTCTATYSDSTNFEITDTKKLYSQEIVPLPSQEVYGVNGEELELTCTYTSQHSSDVQASWQDEFTVTWLSDDGEITNSSSDYDINTTNPTETTLTTKLNIKKSKMTIVDGGNTPKGKTYTCKFESTQSGSNEKTFTIQDVFSISEQPKDQPDVTSGFTTNFSIKLADPDSSNKDTFNISYQWYKWVSGTKTKAAGDSTTESYTTPHVFYDNDQDNQYSCEVEWKSSKETQTLTTMSEKASITIINSCPVVKSLNGQTSVKPTDNYVRDAVVVTTTCEKGFILPAENYSDASQTCSVPTDLNISNCEAGCYVETPADQSLYNGVFTFSDSKKNDSGPEYTTIHQGEIATITCNSGYVVSSSSNKATVTCQSEQALNLKKSCLLGCKLEDPTNNAVYQDTDNLIYPGTTQQYNCRPNTLTSEGRNEATSETCTVPTGVTTNPVINLDKCRALTVTQPTIDTDTSSVTVTIAQPVLQDTAKSTPTVSEYECTATQKDNNAKVFKDTSSGSAAKCVINNLISGESYKYNIKITFKGGATWNSEHLDWQFTTEEASIVPAEPDKDGKIKIDVPTLENPPNTFKVVAVWFKDPARKNVNLEVNPPSKRKKRSTPTLSIDADDIYANYTQMKEKVDEDETMLYGAFYAGEAPTTTDTIDLSTLNLPAGEAFVLAAYVCEKNDQNTCYIGTGTSYNTPPNNTVAIAVGVVVGLLVVVLVASLLLLYKRRPDLFVRKSKPDEHTVFQNPSSNTVQLEEGAQSSTRGTGKPVPLPPDVHEMPDIERRIPDPIHVADFLSKYRRLMQDTYYLLDREYDEIKCEVPPSNFNYLHAKKPENKVKNRFVDILPYDETRVKLRTSPDHPSDYVNACFVTNMSNQLEFIAAQGPKEETMDDFWQMVWENKSLSIVMVTNLVERGRKKCAQYWSDEGTMQYGSVRVTVDGILTFPDYCIRTLIVERGNERRCVYHFHYLIWPDHGAPPTTSLIDFCRRCFSEMVDGPVLVHCSAGVGRTGTLIALHLQMRMLADEQKVDLFGIVCQLRRCRKLMVQTAVQYKFLYQAVREMIICDDTFIAVRDFNQELARLTTPRSGNQYMTLLDDQFKRLEEYCTIHITHDKSEFKTTHGSSGVNHTKNRFSNVLPFDVNRVKLRVTTGETGSDYINASYINSYHERDAFIATQGPKQNTIGDFWRMIFEKEVSTIVMLTPLVDRGRERCTMYWPRDKEEPICVENITVHLLNVANPTAEYTVRTFSISIKNREDETTRQVKQYHYYTWTNSESPSSGKPLIKMIDQVSGLNLFGNDKSDKPLTKSTKRKTKIKNHRRNGPVVVHCSAGIGRTAVFIAVHNCIEQLRQDEMIDLFTIVLRLRLQRNGMVQSMDQYAFCYRVMAEVCSMFDDYVNTQGLHG